MAEQQPRVTPRNYYLNEQHELARGEKKGGGRIPQYVGVDWQSKGKRLKDSLVQTRSLLKQYRDPLRESRYFLLARPESKLSKKSQDKRKAIEGRVSQDISYSGQESRVFSRLGLDLIQVNPDGTATVHARADQFERLIHSSDVLAELGGREKARWATLNSFETIPRALVVDESWLQSIPAKGLIDLLVELQPLLSAVESDEVVRTIGQLLKRSDGDVIRSIGTDFSGRRWIRGKLTRHTLLALPDSLFSIQSIHPPLEAFFLKSRSPEKPLKGSASPKQPAMDASKLPCVAVLDTGVPTDHKLLAPFRRGGFIAPDSSGLAVGDHGSCVASRVVFGSIQFGEELPPAECTYYDVNIAVDLNRTDEKNVLPSLEAIVGAAPDVRVFNFSFDSLRPLDSEDKVTRREKLILLQDLDNFIFARDVLVVIAAGNSPAGVIPSIPYPRHFDDPQWALGTWPRAFNALTCGAYIDSLHPDGVASEIGAPSPFTKCKPGLADSDKPDLCESGGNGASDYRFRPGMGVWTISASSLLEDHAGTSFAAPLLARKAAIVLHQLQKLCESATRPFTCTAKAFLLLSASHYDLPPGLNHLVERTLGKGIANVSSLHDPKPDSAMFMWQGVIGGPDDLVRVQIPIAKEWLKKAAKPELRLVVCWDVPVNAAVEELWASRKINVHLRPGVNSTALTGSRTGHKSYPVIDRIYDLTRVPDDELPDYLWTLDFSYELLAEYYPGIDFSPQQRVGLAAELFDASSNPVSPQPIIQQLGVAATMTRFSLAAVPIKNPIRIRTRL
jgi:hypothetical protein